MEGKLSEFTKIELAIYPRDIGTTDISSTPRDASDYTKFRAHAMSAAMTSAQTFTLQLMQAQAGGLNPKVLGDAVVYTAPAEGGKADIIAEANIDDFDAAGGFTEIGVKLASGTNGLVGTASLELGGASYLPAT